MRKLGRQRRVTKRWYPYGATGLMAMTALQSAAHAQAKPTGLAAYEGLLTTGFFGLLVAFVALVAWEVADNRKASRSSLDIAKLAAAAAKKQSAAGAPSGSLAQLDAPPTSRPFAPPPPPPPPKQPPAPAAEAPREQAMPFAAPPAREEAPNPFAAPPSEMIGASAGSLESTVAFAPPGGDAGASGGWADLLQRVRAGEPEAASFEAAPPPSTEENVFGASSEAAAPTAASSSEAWEALLRRTTTGEGPVAPKSPSGDVGKISLNSSFQVPGSAETPPAPSPFASPGASPFGGGSSEPAGMFGSFDDGSATLPSAGPPGAFSLPSQPPAAAEPPALGMGFSFNEPSAESASPFGGFGGAGFGTAPPTPGAGGSGGFESPAFRLPGSAPNEDLGGGGGGFQLPSGSALGSTIGTNPFDFGGGGGVPENPSSSTLPLSDLFGSKPSGQPPSFQLPSGGGLDFSDAGSDSPGLGRTISLDFAKGGGQKPPPPLPKTEG